MTRARHRAFMAPRLFGSLVVFIAFPVYLVVRGVPSAIEVAAFAWLMAPILICWFLSRTGRYEAAHLLSALSISGLVMTLAVSTDGILSFAAIWIVLIPVEAALSASRRVVGLASALALSCAGMLMALGYFEVLPVPQTGRLLHGVLAGFGVASATLYAAGLAFGAWSLARTSVSLIDREQDRYRLLAGHMSEMISRHRRDGAAHFVSPAAETLLGTSAQSLLGHGLFDRVHVADRPAYLTALSDAARAGEARRVEFRLRRDGAPGAADTPRRGDFIWVEMRCRPFERKPRDAQASEAEVVAVIRDVTEWKLQEQALDLARSAADQADAARTRFLAIMSHELRTPLNAIIGFSDMLVQEEELGLEASRRKDYARLINGSGEHLLSVVNGILDMSKIASGTFEIVPEPFEPRAELHSCCGLLALKAREGGIDLATRVADDLPAMIGDPRAFRQIVLNLISNAVKFTDRGGKVTVSATVEGARLVLWVSDTGVGITADDLKRVGDPFFQAGKTYQRRHEGTGLGLSIVKSLVALQGGEMTVQSKVDQGTTVTIALPLIFSGPAARPASNLATLTPASRPAPADSTLRHHELSKVDQVKKSA